MIIKNINHEIISVEWFACLCQHKYSFICWDRIMPYFIEYAESLDIFTFFITFETQEQPHLIEFTQFYKDCIFIYPDNIHMENYMDCVLQKNCVLFNCEQMSIEKRRDKIEHFLYRGGKLINYSLQNQLILKSHAQDQMLYLPYRCTQRENNILKSLLLQESKEFDVAIVASMTPRRVSFVDSLLHSGVKVCIINNKFGLERDRLIAKCRCLLNIHANEDYTIFETLRCNRWLDVGMLIVSEPCSDIQENHHPCLKIVPTDRIAEYLKNLLPFDSAKNCNIDYLQEPIIQMNQWLGKKIDTKIDMSIGQICYGANQFFFRVERKEIAFLIKKEDNFNLLYGDPVPNVVKYLVILFDQVATRIPEKRKENYYVSLNEKNIQIWMPQ